MRFNICAGVNRDRVFASFKLWNVVNKIIIEIKNSNSVEENYLIIFRDFLGVGAVAGSPGFRRPSCI